MYNLYFQKLKDLFDIIEKKEANHISLAAEKVAQCIQQDGIIHVFGCGHSHMLGEELFYRAGGLVPIQPILFEDLMLHKGAVRSSQLEKQNDYAHVVMENVQIEPNDILLVVSTSGRNPVPIDVAEIARQRGAYVIAITSVVYRESVTSRHRQGKFLADVADLVIDNHIEVGDALIEHPANPVSFGSGSTIVGMMIVNGMMVEATNIMIEHNFTPPIFRSSNADHAEDHNRQLIHKYKKRIPLLDN
ncbi:SIS domain-containing protein [Microbacteriaceae bacterium 4G12]